jgi:hypothetical protein
MRKNKRLLTYGERSDRTLFWYSAVAAAFVFVALVVIPSGLDEWNYDHSETHSQSLLQRMASYF